MKFWRNAAALLSVFHPETTHTGNHSTHKDVKNEGRSDYIYENKARATKCHAKNTAFYTKMHPLRGNRQQSSGPFGRLCTNCTTLRGEVAPWKVVALLEKRRIGDAKDLVEIGARGFDRGEVQVIDHDGGQRDAPFVAALPNHMNLRTDIFPQKRHTPESCRTQSRVDAGGHRPPTRNTGDERAVPTWSGFDLLRITGTLCLGLDRLAQHTVEALDEGGGVFQRHTFEQQSLVEEEPSGVFYLGVAGVGQELLDNLVVGVDLE